MRRKIRAGLSFRAGFQAHTEHACAVYHDLSKSAGHRRCMELGTLEVRYAMAAYRMLYTCLYKLLWMPRAAAEQ